MKTKIEVIYDMIADMTIKRIEKEKETKLSRLTLKMISLTQSLLNSTLVR